jgi:metal transporter CNNM
MGQDFSIAFFDGDYTDFAEIEDIYNCVMAILCVFCAALASGLTMGLLSLDNTKLEIKALIGSNDDRAHASALLPLIKKHHLLLVTLMLFNSLANEALPIFLGSLVPNYLAVLISVVLVLICGEIVPSALFTGPSQLQIAAKLSGVVWFLLILFYPVSYPLSRMLDYFFGAEEADSAVSRVELEALMLLQSEGYKREDDDRDNISLLENSQHPSSSRRDSFSRRGSQETKETRDPSKVLSSREVNIMTGILKISKLNISNVITNIDDVFMVSFDLVLDEKSLSDILLSGFSRVPVYKGHRDIIVGFLLVKTLAVVNPSARIIVGSMFLHQPLIVKPNVCLLEMLTVFREGHRHLALVSEDPIKCRLSFRDERIPKPYARVVGMLTLENVLEKILQEDIIDETDDNPNRDNILNKYGGKMPVVDYLEGTDYSEKKLVLPEDMCTDRDALTITRSSSTDSSRGILYENKLYNAL